jgi:hypothetical protein
MKFTGGQKLMARHMQQSTASTKFVKKQAVLITSAPRLKSHGPNYVKNVEFKEQI